MKYSKNDVKHVFECGLVKQLQGLKNLQYNAQYFDNCEFTLEELNDMVDKLKINPYYSVANAQLNNSKGRKKRYRKWLKKYLYAGYDVAFVTITFSDELFNVAAKTRRTYISRFLKSYPGVLSYIANVDFGDEKNREHYHALVVLDVDFDMDIFCKWNFRKKRWESWDLSFVFAGHCSYSKWQLVTQDKDHFPIWSSSDIKRLSAYTNKLISHGLKLSGRGEFPIFSRNRG